jgi:hypothetical protein
MESFKRIILWDYKRGSWQYDVLCLLIIAFIFLSPKSVLERKEKVATPPSSVAVKARDTLSERNVLEQKVREISENPVAELLNWKVLVDGSGEVIYEIEFR